MSKPKKSDVLARAVEFVESVRAFRLPADATEGSMPFNTLDYHGMDDLIAELRAAAEPPTEGSEGSAEG